VNLANAFEATGRLDQAMLQLAELLHRQPNNAEVANRVGILLAKTGRLDAAIAMFNRALQMDPNYRPAANNLEHAMQQRQGAAATRPR
jgi:tetratricopeptide (TPR) repeat protein